MGPTGGVGTMRNTTRLLVAFLLLAVAPVQAWPEETVVSTELCSRLWIVERSRSRSRM
jgi:hypothetical protein